MPCHFPDPPSSVGAQAPPHNPVKLRYGDAQSPSGNLRDAPVTCDFVIRNHGNLPGFPPHAHVYSLKDVNGARGAALTDGPPDARPVTPEARRSPQRSRHNRGRVSAPVFAHRPAGLAPLPHPGDGAAAVPAAGAGGEAVAPPYPFCRTPTVCAGKGYCPRDIACNG